MAERLLLCLLLAALSACAEQPPCTVSSGVMGAPSAGCLVVDRGELLLVQIRSGDYGPPGGSVNPGESAQCAAERETWEETGVIARAGALAKAFDNGFHLYWCESLSGRDLTMKRPMEIREAGWFEPGMLSRLPWRYAGQGKTIYSLMRSDEP